MNAHDVFCPNPDCPARGRCGEGNIGIHGRTPPRYRCAVCRKTFGARAGTPFYRRSTDETLIALIVTLIAHGCPIAATVAAYGVQRQTVSDWLDAAGSQGEAVHRHLVCQPRDLSAVQADEIRVRQQGRVVWLALAMVVTTRLWLGGVVSPRRDGALIARLCALVKACALPAPLVVCVDGFAAYVKQMRRMARSPLPRCGTRGRCRLVEWPGLVIGQVVKQRADGRVGRGDATIGTRHGGVGGTLARWRHDPDGVHRTAQRHLPGATGTIGTADAGRRADGGAVGARDVAGGSGLQHLHAAWQSGTRADAGDGGGDHRSLLERKRVAALPGASCRVATAEEVGEADESGGGAHRAVGNMTTVPHTPTKVLLRSRKACLSIRSCWPSGRGSVVQRPSCDECFAHDRT